MVKRFQTSATRNDYLGRKKAISQLAGAALWVCIWRGCWWNLWTGGLRRKCGGACCQTSRDQPFAHYRTTTENWQVGKQCKNMSNTVEFSSFEIFNMQHLRSVCDIHLASSWIFAAKPQTFWSCTAACKEIWHQSVPLHGCVLSDSRHGFMMFRVTTAPFHASHSKPQPVGGLEIAQRMRLWQKLWPARCEYCNFCEKTPGSGQDIVRLCKI